MKRRRIIIALLPALLVVALAGMFRWLLFSESGARFAWQRIVSAVPGELRAERVEGALKTQLRISGLSYRDGDLRVTLDRGELRMDLDLWPLALSFGELRLNELLVELPPDSAEPGDPATALEALALPFPVEFERLEAQRLLVSGPGADPLADVRALVARVEWFRRLRVERLQVDLAEPELRVEGQLGLRLERPFALELDARGSLPAGSFGLETPQTVEVRLAGDLGRLDATASAGALGLTVTGTLSELLNEPRWDLRAESPRLDWPPGASAPVWSLERLDLSSHGVIANYAVEGSAALREPGGSAQNLRVVGAGTATGLSLERAVWEGDRAAAAGSGSMQWSPAVSAELRLEIERLDPRPWWSAWGAAPPVAGEMALRWSGDRIEVSGLMLSAPKTVERLAGSGTFALETGELVAELSWQGLAWPPGAETPALTSEGGHGNLGGGLDAWRFEGAFGLAGVDVPPGRVRMSARGDRQGLEFEVPEGEVLGGRFAADGAVRWAPQLDWRAAATVDKLRTAPLHADFPGTLSGRLAASGQEAEDRIDVRFERLEGTVREREVQATGALSWVGGRIEADHLVLRSGSSELALHGSPRAATGLEMEAGIASLGDLVDGAAGSLHGRAWLRRQGTAEPELRLDLEGEGLAWQAWSLDRIEALAGETGGHDLVLELVDLAGPDVRLDSLRVVAAGAAWLERVELQAKLPGGSIGLGLDEGKLDWSQPLAYGWRGRLHEMLVEGLEPGDRLELEEPASLLLSTGRVDLEGACLRGPREGRMCLDAWLQPRGERAAQASLEHISPNTLLSFAGSGLSLSHRVSGSVSWRQLPASRPTAQVDLAISAGDLRFEGEQQPVLETDAGFFGFAIEDGRLHGGRLDLPLKQGGGVDMEFSVPDLSGGLDSEVRGRLLVELSSIEPLLELTASLEGGSGPLTADMRFSGTLGDPQFTGYVSVVRGRILHFPTGLQLEDLQLAGAVYQFDQSDLRGTFRAGDGRGEIRAVMNFHDMLEPEFRLELNGENLRLIDVPDLRVEANPDVVLTWREETLQVRGRVTVPSARLSPRYLPTSAVSESPDAVIVAGVDPLAVEEVKEAREWAMRGKLALELGQDVELVLDRARARLTGKSTFTWQGAPLPVANGGFRVSGEINAYGQLLRIEEGRVNFSDRPADNPFLNIRAEREIYGNSQTRTAGVLVTGSLKNPVLEPYTEPLTTRERALALLVTGSDFDYEQGVGAVQVGMYVAPKLYISYGVGLFDDQNVISARYELGKGFAVRATSGQRETGVDIDYTVER